MESTLERRDDHDPVERVDRDARHVPPSHVVDARVRHLERLALDARLHVEQDDVARLRADEAKVAARRHARHGRLAVGRARELASPLVLDGPGAPERLVGRDRDDVVPVARARGRVRERGDEGELERRGADVETGGFARDRACMDGKMSGSKSPVRRAGRGGSGRTLRELEPARVAHDARVPNRAVGAGSQERLAVVAVVANEVRRSVVTRALLEETRRRGGRVEEPLLRAGRAHQLRAQGDAGSEKGRTLSELSPALVTMRG